MKARLGRVLLIMEDRHYYSVLVSECLSRASYSVLNIYKCMFFMFLTMADLVKSGSRLANACLGQVILY